MSHISYSGAGHNWQSSNPARINDRRRITEGCRMQFNADNRQVELGTGESLAVTRDGMQKIVKYWRTCTAKRGVKEGRHGATDAQATKDLLEFLDQTLARPDT